jgi:hypothetical protein
MPFFTGSSILEGFGASGRGTGRGLHVFMHPVSIIRHKTVKNRVKRRIIGIPPVFLHTIPATGDVSKLLVFPVDMGRKTLILGVFFGII